MPAFGGEEGPDDQQQEQALGVRHREHRGERVDREEASSERRAASAKVWGAESDEEPERDEERDVRDDDGDHALEPRERQGQRLDQRGVQRRERDVRVGTGYRQRLIAVPHDPQVIPAVPARQAAEDRTVGAWIEQRVARDERLRDERSRHDQQPRHREHRDDGAIEPQLGDQPPKPTSPARRGQGGGNRRVHGRQTSVLFARGVPSCVHSRMGPRGDSRRCRRA